MEIDGVKILLQMWDTAGQERFKSIVPNYYRGTEVPCSVCVCVCVIIIIICIYFVCTFIYKCNTPCGDHLSNWRFLCWSPRAT